MKKEKRKKNRWVVDEATGCWNWQLARTQGGHGITTQDGKRVMAHRQTYEELEGPIPEGLQLDHLCRNRACVNPKHLQPVTCAENIRRGLQAKLSKEDVRKIRELRPTTSTKELAGVYAVTVQHIRTIVREAQWKGI